MRVRRTLVVAAALLASIPATAHARAGAVDPTFGRLGVANADVGQVDMLTGLAVQKDQKILATGWALNTTAQFGVARFTANGTIDRTFSGDGVARVTIGQFDLASDVEQASDGKVVVAGTSVRFTKVNGEERASADLAVVRFLSNGALDSSFSSDGIAVAEYVNQSVTDGDWAADVVVQPDGKIVVAGTTPVFVQDPTATVGMGTGLVTLARFQNNGMLDPTFGTGGRAHVRLADFTNLGGIALQRDGSIVLAGSQVDFSSTTGMDMVVARLTSAGLLDPTFGAAGKIAVDFGGGHDHATDVAVAKNGAITAAGAGTVKGKSYTAIMRTTAAGVLDKSFDKDGKVHHASLLGSASGLVVQDDGKTVVTPTGCRTQYGLCTSTPKIARLTKAGAIDRSFGTRGTAKPTYPFTYGFGMGLWRQSTALAIQNGKVILGASVIVITPQRCSGGMCFGGSASVDLGVVRFQR